MAQCGIRNVLADLVFVVHAPLVKHQGRLQEVDVDLTLIGNDDI